MSRVFRRSLCALPTTVVLAMVMQWSVVHTAQAQFFRGSAVGGVKVDVDGVLSNAEVGELRELQDAWQAGLQNVPADLAKPVDLRFVSLRQIEKVVAEAAESGKPLPDAVKYLAGLQRVRYVLVYPETHDVVLAGPAEGWRVDARGNVVGATTGRPVVLLQDLIVALRTAESSNQTGISCSIDPTPEGVRRWQQLRLSSEPRVAARQMEEAVGDQNITVTGVPATSHFARTLVAADFRMKRLGMGFEPAPVDGLPSYLDMLGRGPRGTANPMPRWWLAPNYEPLRRDTDGLAWEIRGQGVKCMSEQDLFTASGGREHTGSAEPTAQRWAELMTSKYEELAREDSAFGELRNVMDLAVVAALLAKENLLVRSGLEMPELMSAASLDEYNAPRKVASQASFVKKGRSWVVSVSGGVQIFPWQVADRTEVAAELATTRPKVDSAASNAWWWQPS
jgi:hypothetical protein